jgi:hypothetical protein
MMKNKFKMWWKNLFRTPEELYLSESMDIIDLENRLRNMEYNRYMQRMGRYDSRFYF